MKLHFFQCSVCGKLIAVLNNSTIPTICCGQTMKELFPNQTDGATEKHIPVFNIFDNVVSVKVGSVAHPMTDEHSIKWIGIATTQGFQVKGLGPGDIPKAEFCIDNKECVEEVFAYCNLHGLWSCTNK